MNLRFINLSFVTIFLLSFSFSLFADEVKIPQEHAPTIYLEKTPQQFVRPKKPLGPVLLDARPAFDFAMGHLPQALSIRWQDYSQTQEPHKGALDPDLDLLSRKLRFLGISPEREVIVLGSGPKGQGEDGRIAWMLSYLGIKKILLQNFLNVPGKRTVDDLAKNEAALPWNPKPRVSLRIKQSELLKLIQDKNSDYVLIDVREASAFKKHIPGSINIPWTSFIDQKSGDPLNKNSLRALLEKSNIDLNKRLVFYSDHGLTSGYAAFVAFLADLNSANYDGSFDEWSADSRMPLN